MFFFFFFFFFCEHIHHSEMVSVKKSTSGYTAYLDAAVAFSEQDRIEI